MTDQVIDLLSDVSHRFQQRLRDAVQEADVGLTHFEARALVTIARLPGSSQQVISARIGCDKAQLTRAIKVLEGKRLIERETSKLDWRAWDLTLTPAGRAVFADLQARRERISRDCLADVSEEERLALFQILTKMSDGLTVDCGR